METARCAWRVSALAAVLCAGAAPWTHGTHAAQTLSFVEWRRELGMRVQAAEAAYFGAEDATARERAVGPMDRAVRAFFRGDAAEVASQLEWARLAVRMDGVEPHPAARLAPRVEALVLDASRTSVAVHIDVVGRRQAFEVEESESMRLHWRIAPDRGALDRPAIEGPLFDASSAPLESAGWVPVDPSAFPAFDVELPEATDAAELFALELAFDGGARGVLRRTVPIERIPRLLERLDTLRTSVRSATWPAELALERDTVAAWVERLQAAVGGDSGEARWSASAALGEAERLATAPPVGRRLALGVSAPGDHWLVLNRNPARWFVPPDLCADGPVPLVVALHGAGGSENLFFDGHGGGRIVQLAAERGWFVLAPRAGLFGARDLESWIAELEGRWPIDRSAVLLVGHSMGAASAIRELRRSPDSYLAAALLGGGGNAGDPRALHGVALLVAAGDRDFGLFGARQLAKALAQSGHPRSTFAVVPRCEHLLVVPLALPAAFALFDGALAER